MNFWIFFVYLFEEIRLVLLKAEKRLIIFLISKLCYNKCKVIVKISSIFFAEKAKVNILNVLKLTNVTSKLMSKTFAKLAWAHKVFLCTKNSDIFTAAHSNKIKMILWYYVYSTSYTNSKCMTVCFWHNKTL